MQVCYNVYYILSPFSDSDVSHNFKEFAMQIEAHFTFFLFLAVA